MGSPQMRLPPPPASPVSPCLPGMAPGEGPVGGAAAVRSRNSRTPLDSNGFLKNFRTGHKVPRGGRPPVLVCGTRRGGTKDPPAGGGGQASPSSNVWQGTKESQQGQKAVFRDKNTSGRLPRGERQGGSPQARQTTPGPPPGSESPPELDRIGHLGFFVKFAFSVGLR